ncbi:hypothetical protein BKA62DRAFT_700266 [Auriculariales sp. MPI-PUGE-AT-0066]|nr:hypothetical protein BKA62DRAFT_700266 [Auriculariales sp. MPI-PUGE-AT-0066]
MPAAAAAGRGGLCELLRLVVPALLASPVPARKPSAVMPCVGDARTGALSIARMACIGVCMCQFRMYVKRGMFECVGERECCCMCVNVCVEERG